MEELSFTIITVIERAYDSAEECVKDEKEMLESNFEVIADSHEDYPFYRKYKNKF